MKDNEWVGVVLLLVILGWACWPAYNWSSSITLHGYACVQYQDSHWHVADYNGSCSGTERNIEDGSVTFRVFPETQRVAAKTGAGWILSMDHCAVFDVKNWECSKSTESVVPEWQMHDGNFQGTILSEITYYGGYWSWLWRYTNGAALKEADVIGP